MIRDQVDAYNQAVVSLNVRGPAGQWEAIDVVIDTGFTGYLTLPPPRISPPCSFRSSNVRLTPSAMTMTGTWMSTSQPSCGTVNRGTLLPYRPKVTLWVECVYSLAISCSST